MRSQEDRLRLELAWVSRLVDNTHSALSRRSLERRLQEISAELELFRSTNSAHGAHPAPNNAAMEVDSACPR